jgi:hypothetical protein
MQNAAEGAREETLARFSGEAKLHIEQIHADSASEATELRKRADDDVAEIRDWSKTEIARIREETDTRIGARKNELETEIEEHAAAIEARIERVQARVAAFEDEMAAFFERLLAEEDPTRFAAMAESLPEPPAFDGAMPITTPRVAVTAAVATAPIAEAEPTEAEPAEAAPTEVEPQPAEAISYPAHDDDPAPQATDDVVEAPAEPVQDTVEAPQDAPAGAGADLFSIPTAEPVEVDADGASDAIGQDDPRLSALSIDPDFAAAEAEAAAFSPDDSPVEEEIPVIADDALAARLAGLVPDAADAGQSDTHTTRVEVVGLVSVASIAGFKRHLSRVPGVHSVGVSSGPDGEFVFAVSHGAELSLHDAIPALPGFGARVTGESDGGLSVAAHDPETEG